MKLVKILKEKHFWLQTTSTNVSLVRLKKKNDLQINKCCPLIFRDTLGHPTFLNKKPLQTYQHACSGFLLCVPAVSKDSGIAVERFSNYCPWLKTVDPLLGSA